MRRAGWYLALVVCVFFALSTAVQAADDKQAQQPKQEKQQKMDTQGKTEKQGMRSFSGKVTAVDPKAIVIQSGQGKGALTVGAIVTNDTALMVKGKKVSINDLTKEVKAGDTVKLQVERTTDLYAKQISK